MVKKITFEEAITQLEQIVSQLEQGELNLDSSLSLFEKGIAMSRICSEHLDKAEKKIEYLINPQIEESTVEKL